MSRARGGRPARRGGAPGQPTAVTTTATVG